MKTQRKVIVGTAIAVALCGATLAGNAIAGHRDNDGREDAEWYHDRHHGDYDRRPSMKRILERFDTNSDGKLTQDEISQAQTTRLKQFDTDSDGQLSLEEFQALWVQEKRNRMVDRFQKLYDDGDAVVTEAEFLAPFEGVDRDGDGEITPKEMQCH